MLGVIQRTTLGLFILLIMPVIVWLTGWSWQPGGDERILKVFFMVTETVSFPWGKLTAVVLACWFVGCLRLRFRFRPSILLSLFLLLLVTIGIGQQLNSVIKSKVKEPRPFVLWLEQEYHVTAREFYQIPRAQRVQLLDEQLAQYPRIPSWLKAHWRVETGFAFPSGHSMFAASWVLLAFALLIPVRSYFSVVVITLWGIGVMGSRLLLGMHWPWDLIMAAVISWVLVNIACFFILRWCMSSNNQTA